MSIDDNVARRIEPALEVTTFASRKGNQNTRYPIPTLIP